MNNSPEFIGQMKNPPPAFRPVAFWFLNHRLEADELRRQVHEMADKGLGGFMAHARDGLRTGYLKEDWAEALETAIETAEQRGLLVWLYDENHYPSGPAGDNLAFRFPDRTMKSLAVRHEEILAPGAEWILPRLPRPGLNMVIAASLEQPRAQDLSGLVSEGQTLWRSPDEWGRTLVLVLEEAPWQSIPSHKFAFYPDYFDPDLTDDFIRLTHQWYFDRFGKKFGRTIQGIFSDNSCANFGYIRRACPWGKDFERRFHSATGLSLRDILPGVFCSAVPNAGLARLIFWRFIGRTYLDAYFKRIRTFCDRAGLLSAGHLCLEDGMGEHARQIGDYFEVMRSFSLTATDQLGPPQAGDSMFECQQGEKMAACIKNTASAARFQGSSRVMCESFGLASGYWALDLFEIRRISGWLATLGVNLFVPHGLFYSIAGGRKWECTPDHFHSPLWPYYRAWTDWIARLCLASAGGINLAEVVVLYPIHSLRAALELGQAPKTTIAGQMNCGPLTAECGPLNPAGAITGQTDATLSGFFRRLPDVHGEWPVSDRGAATDFIEATYLWTVNALVREQIDFEVADEEILSRADEINNGGFQLPSPGSAKGRTFKVLVLPAVTVLEKRTATLIEKMLKAGVQIVLLNARPVALFDPERNEMETYSPSFARVSVFSVGADSADKVAAERGRSRPTELIDIKVGQRPPDAPPFNSSRDDFRILSEYSRENVQALSINPVNSNASGREGLAGALISKIAPSIFVAGEVREQGNLVTRAWEKDGQRFYLMFNSGTQAAQGRVRINERAPLAQIDLDSGEVKAWIGAELHWTFEPAQALLLASGLKCQEPLNVVKVRTETRVETIPLAESWDFSAAVNSLPLREWQVKVSGPTQVYSMSFESRLDLPSARLLMDQERSTPELESKTYGQRFQCFLNGVEIKNFLPGALLDRNIYEAELGCGLIRKGQNVLEIKTGACLTEWEYRLWPPIIAGAFKVVLADGRSVLDAPEATLRTGSWVEQGYPFFAGEGRYSQNITLPALLPDESLYLDLGNAANAVRVNFNGQPAGTRIAPPWRFELTPWAGQTGKLEIYAANTPHNLFMESPRPAGLLGPVSLKLRRKTRMFTTDER